LACFAPAQALHRLHALRAFDDQAPSIHVRRNVTAGPNTFTFSMNAHVSVSATRL
jgi:hypothetical protein